MANVSWGLSQLKTQNDMVADVLCVLDEFEGKVLQVLDRHLGNCTSESLAVALDRFSEANYPRLGAQRVAELIRKNYLEANGQNVARYLYVSSNLGVDDLELKLALGQRIVGIADNP